LAELGIGQTGKGHKGKEAELIGRIWYLPNWKVALTERGMKERGKNRKWHKRKEA
jgi:hypothetical protein